MIWEFDLTHSLSEFTQHWSQGPRCSAQPEVACGESTRTVAPLVVRCQEHGVIWQGNGSVQHHAFLWTRHWQFLAIFWQILPQLKNFSQKCKRAHHPRRPTRRHLCAKSNVLMPFQSWDSLWREKTVRHRDTHPAYFATREPQCSGNHK